MLRLHNNAGPPQPSQLINVTVRRDLLNLHRGCSDSNMSSTDNSNTKQAEEMMCGMRRELTTDWTRLNPIVAS